MRNHCRGRGFPICSGYSDETFVRFFDQLFQKIQPGYCRDIFPPCFKQFGVLVGNSCRKDTKIATMNILPSMTNCYRYSLLTQDFNPVVIPVGTATDTITEIVGKQSNSAHSDSADSNKMNLFQKAHHLISSYTILT